MARSGGSESGVFVMRVERGTIDFCVVGTSPLIMNRMSEKVKRDLALPAGRKTDADKASNAKHDPRAEYQESAYKTKGDEAPSLLAMPSTAFKSALATAALDMPGAKKTQIGRLTFISGDFVGIFGVPKIFMTVTRSADIKKTPDIRTRAILPEWACTVSVNFVRPILREQSVATLLAGAGMYIGIGDYRAEKGKGNYGQFRLASPDDQDFVRITENGGRGPQLIGMQEPECYDDETANLFHWCEIELTRRGFKIVRDEGAAGTMST